MKTARMMIVAGMAAIVLSACATPYDMGGLPVGLFRGSKTEQLDDKTYRIYVNVSTSTKRQTAFDHANLRMAQQTLEAGYPYFRVLNFEDQSKRQYGIRYKQTAEGTGLPLDPFRLGIAADRYYKGTVTKLDGRFRLVSGEEAKDLPRNQFYHAWGIYERLAPKYLGDKMKSEDHFAAVILARREGLPLEEAERELNERWQAYKAEQ
ncbi:hypothetical protein [Erythrobacter sp. YT30]|uniref:hypothetical protein n=1 Tax=Erythrobacter sp. YT30 TaxID=1735012 RepID=UPI00076D67E0|nr:hypothetical protein [Erythrobacter sp. YT30]KWV93150.1 hypothetical protein AUC45_03235 [Erythrobacter sp. YT30]